LASCEIKYLRYTESPREVKRGISGLKKTPVELGFEKQYMSKIIVIMQNSMKESLDNSMMECLREMNEKRKDELLKHYLLGYRFDDWIPEFDYFNTRIMPGIRNTTVFMKN
jgi:hypothetical protein